MVVALAQALTGHLQTPHTAGVNVYFLAVARALAPHTCPDARARSGPALFGHKHDPSGLYERIFLGLELLWVALTAVYIATRQLSANRFK